MKILGISCFYHDAAACLLEDGDILAAAQEERFSRIKHDPSFPAKAIEFCLSSTGTRIKDLEAIVFYDKPLLKFERILETFYAEAPQGLVPFVKGIPVWAKEKLFFKKLLFDNLKKIEKIDRKSTNILFSTHHLSHAASAFYPSPFDEAAIVTLDGVVEWETLAIGKGKGTQIEILKTLHFPDSVGLFYSAFTFFLGFKVNSGEYKLMGMAPYGNEHSDNFRQMYRLIKEELIVVKKDGSVRLNKGYFSFTSTLKIIPKKKWETLFGIKKRTPETAITQSHCDLALAAQKVTEDIVLSVAGEARQLTGSDNLCLAGGVALNCVANSAIQKSGLYKDIWVQPAAGDAGGALGAASAAYYLHFKGNRVVQETDSMKNALLGPAYTDEQALHLLKDTACVYENLSRDDLIKKTASFILNNKVVGWFQGKMEFGPRALGNRSILADARSHEMQSKLNLKIKFRESFRPFAPAVLEEDAALLFEQPNLSPYMLLTSDIKEEFRSYSEEDLQSLPWEEKLKAPKSHFPAVTHVDFSSRLQTVGQGSHPLFLGLLKQIKTETGWGIVVNTSFNVRGEPIVESPLDAYRCFMHTGMDVLVIGNFIFEKTKQPTGNK